MQEKTNKVVLGIITILTFSIVASVYSEIQVGVKTGDWIRYSYTITGAPEDLPIGLSQWARVEFLSVEEAGGSAGVVMHFSDGREYNDTMPWSLKSGGVNLGTFQGIVIPANSETGDLIFMIGYGNQTIASETTRAYAGASRRVVYASFYSPIVDRQFEYYWDKQTGVMVEASAVGGGVTGIIKATDTNMWQAQIFGLEPIVFYALIIVVIAIAAIVAFFVIHKRKSSSPSP